MTFEHLFVVNIKKIKFFITLDATEPIKNIDDPFDYQNNGESGYEINLDVFNDHLKSLK